jgi:hypothetical protein
MMEPVVEEDKEGDTDKLCRSILTLQNPVAW